MNLLKWLLGHTPEAEPEDDAPPRLTRAEWNDRPAIIIYLRWWIDNDPFLERVRDRNAATLWKQGFRPLGHDYHEVEDSYRYSLEDWLIQKVSEDLDYLSEFGGADQDGRLDWLMRNLHQTLVETGTIGAEIARVHGMEPSMVDYERVLHVVTDDGVAETLTAAYLTHLATSARFRAMSLIYEETHGREYGSADPATD